MRTSAGVRYPCRLNGTSVTTNHYSDGTDSPAWSATSATAFTRSLDGIDGGFAVSVDQTGAATFELANMHGDIVATALDTTTDIGIQTGSYSESTEYGAPRVAAAASTSYGWLGSAKRSSDALGGMVLMGVRLCNADTGRFLSTDPIYGGSANPYVYPANPISGRDTTGDYWSYSDEWSGYGDAWAYSWNNAWQGVGRSWANYWSSHTWQNAQKRVGTWFAHRPRAARGPQAAKPHEEQRQSNGKSRKGKHEKRDGYGGQRKNPDNRRSGGANLRIKILQQCESRKL